MEKNRPESPKDGDRNGTQNRSDRQAPPPPPPSDSEGSRRPNNDSDMRNKMDKQRAAFDKKVQKILNQDQYAQYQANKKKHHDMMTKEAMENNLKKGHTTIAINKIVLIPMFLKRISTPIDFGVLI